MNLTELCDAQRKLEEAKVCSIKLFVVALKSLAKLQYEACLERMTMAVEEAGLESCGGEQSFLDIFDMITKVAAANPDVVAMQWLYRSMQLKISNSTVLADEAARRVSTANAKNRPTGGDSLEVQPHSSEMEVQPNAPELEVQPHSSEMQVQPNAPELEVRPHSSEMQVQFQSSEMEFQPNAPEIEVQPDAPQLEVQSNALELEVQPDAPELEVQPNAPDLEAQPNAPELEVHQHSSDSEVQSQSSDPEDPSTASSRSSMYMQIPSDESVADYNLPNFDELQYLHRSFKPQEHSDRSNLTFPLSSDESSVGQTNSTVGSSADQSNSAVGSSEVQSNSAFGTFEVQSHSTDSQAYSSGPHSSDGSPDGCSPNSFLAPAGVYVNLEAGRAYIANFITPEQHLGYLLNMTHEIICIGNKIEYVKKELEKLNDQSGIPRETRTLTTENTGKD